MNRIANIIKCMFVYLVTLILAVLSVIIITLQCAPSAMAESKNLPLLDLAFVIDNSGSMKLNDPDFITPALVRTFIKEQSRLNYVSIILFDKRARLLMPLSPLSDNHHDKTVETALARIDYRGQFTNTSMGIERALYELTMKGRSNSQKGIVLITDGIVDSGDPAKDRELTRWLKEDLTRKSKNLEVRIFGVALSEAADFSLIQTLATRTGGEYYRTYEAGQISDLLRQIQIKMAPPPVREQRQPPKTIGGVEVKKTEETAEKESTATEPFVSTDSSKESAVNGKTLVVVKKGRGVLMTVAIVLSILVIAIAFFQYMQNGKSPADRRSVRINMQKAYLNMPEAYLQHMGINITNAVNGAIKIEKERTKIGRGRNNDIVLNQPEASGVHATIEYRNSSYYLEDHHSTNGTKLNGRKLSPNEPVRLKNNDTITFAKWSYKFLIADSLPFGDTVMLSLTTLTEIDPDATVVKNLDFSDNAPDLLSCLKSHINQIDGLGDKYKEYINTYFSQKTLEKLASVARENLRQTNADLEQHCEPVVENSVFYLICSLPVSMSAAPEWYGRKHEGFIKFILNQMVSEPYLSSKCDQLCVITCGQDPSIWVSITIVPDHSDLDPVEIMSVDFLSEEEKALLDYDFDQYGRVV